MAALVATAWLSGLQPAAAVEAGQAAPDLELALADGATRLSALKGKVVYLDFWASWCGPCKLSFPWMNDLQARHAARGLQVVAVNLDARRADADAFLERHPARFTLAFDAKGESARQVEVKAMPSSYVIGADGVVRVVHRGFRLDDRAALEASIVEALSAATTAKAR